MMKKLLCTLLALTLLTVSFVPALAEEPMMKLGGWISNTENPAEIPQEVLDAFNKAYEEGYLTRVIASNLTYRRPELLRSPWFIEADLSKYISYIIATLNHDRTLHELLNPYDRIKNLLTRYKAEQAAAGIRLV